ncbi:MAG TPA: MarR family transcriptional regulator [Candidatus Acidoferrum sp.]
MQTLEQRLKLAKPLSLHTRSILSLVIAAQGIMARVGAACERHGVTRPQYNVLRVLRGAGPAGHPRHEISARVVEKAPDVTRILNRLAAAGYVKRGRSSEDRRESVARITAKGLVLLLAVDQSVSKEEHLIGDCLRNKEWTTLALLCQRLFLED